MKFSSSKWRWLGAFFVCTLLTAYFHQGKKINGVIWSDQEGYYIYLPAVFVNGGFDDLYCYNGCSFIQKEGIEYSFTKYTYGVALMQSPFFLFAHSFAQPLGFESNGRTLPYIWSVMIAAIFYMLFGLYLLGETLKSKLFSNRITAIVLFGILLGTNLFYYTFREAGMSHVYSFFLLSVLIYSAEKKSKTNKSIWDLLSGFLLALIILIRPTNAIAVLIPVLWNANLSNAFSSVIQFLKNWKWILAFTTSAIILFSPQLYYWKELTGNYIFYSYGEEGFIYWNRPKMLSVLFSPQNGWLIYSPLAIGALVGIVLMIKQKIAGWLTPILTLTIATYVFGSWWAWWFGGAYGHRCYVDFLPLLAIPAATLVKSVQDFGVWFQRLFGIAACIAIYVNVRMSDFYHGMWDGPDWGWRNYIEKLLEAFYL